jgi:hypothetical protein
MHCLLKKDIKVEIMNPYTLEDDHKVDNKIYQSYKLKYDAKIFNKIAKGLENNKYDPKFDIVESKKSVSYKK